MKNALNVCYARFISLHLPSLSLLFLFLVLATAFPGFSQTNMDSMGSVRWSVSLRPYVSRTWVEDEGFHLGPLHDKPAFSYAAQIGASFPLSPRFRFFAGIGYNVFRRKQVFYDSDLQVNDPTDPVYQSLLGNPPTFNYWNHFLDIPARLDFTPSKNGRGLVIALASTQSWWLSGRRQSTAGYGLPAREGSIKAPETRFFWSQEIQAGWIFPFASGWQADARVFVMADLIRMKNISSSRTGLGLQLSVTMGK